MDILTIYNYVEDERYFNLLKVWLKQVEKYNDINGNIKVLSYLDIPQRIETLRKEYNFEWVKLGLRDKVNHPFLDKHNVRFKLFNLTSWKNPYLFIDVDAFVFENLSEITKFRNDKPWIGINHQNIPLHTENKGEFLNSGVQLVSDVNFVKYDDIIMKVKKILCPGFDQALLFSYFNEIGYDYTHNEISKNWNACAGYSRTFLKDDKWVCESNPVCLTNENLVSKEIKKGEKIFINHYWDEFKPWNINCEFYKNNI